MTTLDQPRAQGDSARSGSEPRSELATHLPLETSPHQPELLLPSERASDVRALDATEPSLPARRLAALGTLAGSIAHDFGNALQSITGNTALAQRCLEPSHPARAFLDEVARAGARADELVQRIVRFSRPEQPARRAISLRGAVEEALTRVRPTLPAQIAVRAQLSMDVGLVLAGAAEVQQLIASLTVHAAHAIMGARVDDALRVPAGTIDVRLGETSLLATPDAVGPALPAGSYAVLQISDDGPGLDSSTLARIFDPFFTSPAAGVGLSVVHGIMKGLGGAVSAHGDLGGGTTFRLYFPTHEARAGTSAAQLASPAGPNGRILFVDDEEVLLSLGTHMLEVLGYEVSGTSLPLAALKRVALEPRAYDAVVTDLSMPGLSGFQLSQQLLALRADLPIVVMSGSVGPDERACARKVGVRELLLKPLGMDDLHRTLTRVLASPRRRAAVHTS